MSTLYLLHLQTLLFSNVQSNLPLADTLGTGKSVSMGKLFTDNRSKMSVLSAIGPPTEDNIFRNYKARFNCNVSVFS